ncbi:hypothetical protein Pfo_016707 [Paulownia fortunei]|nr:hypothetical protein Pfo_016707 [Paulownia fortunei]
MLTTQLEDPQDQLLRYHNGALLHGRIAVNLIWYGRFKPSQRAIVADFITSLSASPPAANQPSVATWWRLKHHRSPYIWANNSDENYSLGKSLSEKQIVQLASKGDQKNAINVVLTASDVAVDGFCVNRCGTHGSKNALVKGRTTSLPTSGLATRRLSARSPPLVAPNNDLGLDGMVMSLSGLLAGTATNPFGNGFYQGPSEAPLEAASACPGLQCAWCEWRKYLLPAIFDPSTSKCSTLV